MIQDERHGEDASTSRAARILFITRKFPPSVGGMEIYSYELYNALRILDRNVSIYKPRRPILGRPSLMQLAGFFFGAARVLVSRRRNYQAVLLGDFALASLAVVAKLATRGKARIVVSVHGNDLYFIRKRGPKAFVYRFLCRAVIGRRVIDAAIANSNAIRREAMSMGLSPVHVIALATSVPNHAPQVQGSRHAILFAGRLIKYKGLAWFVQEVLPGLDPALELLVAGPVWDQSESDCLQGQTRIQYLGSLSRDELFVLRSQVLACIMPNLPPGPNEQDEGFGLSALEGPAVGTPTVAARCGGLADAVADGITGFLLPPLDRQAWIQCLNEIARWSGAQRTEFAVRAREYVSEHFNWTRVAQRTLSVLAAE